MSTYKFAGVSRLKGELKVRFANDSTRVKVLAKNGHTDIDLIELTAPMSKEDAIAFLMSINFYEKDGVVNEEVRTALVEAVDRRSTTVVAANKERRGNKEAKKPKKDSAPKTPTKSEITLDTIAAKAPKAPKSTLSKKDIEKQLADAEDAPF